MSLVIETIAELDGMTITVRVEGERLLAVGDPQLAAARAADRAHHAVRAALLEPVLRSEP